MSTLPKHKPKRPPRHDTEYAQDVVRIPKRGSSPRLGGCISGRAGSPEEETLKMNLEGQCETVRKEI